eukprot:scaffold5169_cov239-Pinguiococcus_pyrenoidosus.AAC.1
MNTLLANLIVDSDYFVALREVTTYNETVAEVMKRCTHAEPWAAGTARSPSTFFCLLFKCFTIRLTMNQMKGPFAGSPGERAGRISSEAHPASLLSS